MCTDLIDGDPDAVRSYLRHFWSHWSGPGFELASEDEQHLVSVCGPPGAFAASISWYRAGAGSVARSLSEQPPSPPDRIAVPVTVLRPAHDPLFPAEWSDRIGDYFANATLTQLGSSGHFIPREAPQALAAAILAAASRQPGRS